MAGDDFGLAYCFEALTPGTPDIELITRRELSAVSMRRACEQAAQAVYGIIIKAPIIKARDCQTAELVKLVENIYRDVNIAFINEIALLCEEYLEGSSILNNCRTLVSLLNFSSSIILAWRFQY